MLHMFSWLFLCTKKTKVTGVLKFFIINVITITEAGLAQCWKHLPSTNLAQVQIWP